MTTFDAWEGLIRPSNDYLAHHGIRGMKHGRNRYQNPDGSWTEEGLARRKKREGWGDKRAEKKAAKYERKISKAREKMNSAYDSDKAAEYGKKLSLYVAKRNVANGTISKGEYRNIRKADRLQDKREKQEIRAEQKAAYKEAMRKSKAKTMTTEELKEQIERLKLENEYRELKKSPLLKTGEKLVTDYLQNKHAKEERAYNDKQTKLAREHEMAKLKEQTEQTKIKSEADKERAKADAERAKADKTRADTDRVDIEKGTRMVKLKNEKKSLKLQNRRLTSDGTIRGGIGKAINKLLAGNAENSVAVTKGLGDALVAKKRGKAEASIAVKQARKLNRYNKNHHQYAWQTQASIPEGGFDYGTHPFDGNKNDENKKKNKKNKGGSQS